MADAIPSTPSPVSTVLRWVSNSIAQRSPLSGSVQLASRLGGYWELEVQYPPMRHHVALSWESAVFGLDGVATALAIGPDQPREPDAYNANPVTYASDDSWSLRLDFTGGEYTARYVDALTITADGGDAAQSTTLDVTGLDGIGLMAGTKFVVSNGTYNELHVITAEAWPDSNGDATVSIHPPLRKAVSNGAAVTIDSPKGEFILDAGNGAPTFTKQPGGVTVMSALRLREFVR